MNRTVLTIVLAALLAAGCRLYFWAGERELVVPAEPEPTATPTA